MILRNGQKEREKHRKDRSRKNTLELIVEGKKRRGKDQRWYKKEHVRNREIKEESTYVPVIGVESEVK